MYVCVRVGGCYWCVCLHDVHVCVRVWGWGLLLVCVSFSQHSTGVVTFRRKKLYVSGNKGRKRGREGRREIRKEEGS